MWSRLVLALMLPAFLAACTRPLSPQETGFIRQFAGDAVDLDRIRVHPGLIAVTRTAPVSPRLTCKSRLYPPPPGKTFRGAAPAMTLWNHVLIRSDWHDKSMAGDWPEVLDMSRAMLLAHEVLHVWQWQQRARTGYTPFRAFGEHFAKADPYLFDPGTKADFASFGYEQQGAILEEYLCCRLLAPDAERTERLHGMLTQVMPVTPVSTPLAKTVRLPWRGIELEGICGA